MGQITFTIKYKKNTGTVLSVSELLSFYLYGIKIQGNQGADFSDEALKMYILAAQKEVENWFSIKFQKQLIGESLAYNRCDYWQQFPILITKYPVNQTCSLIGMLGKIEQTIYPELWLTHQKSTDGIFKRRMSVVPTGSGTTVGNSDIILTGVTSQIGTQRFNNIPDYWEYQYITGFDLEYLPYDLINIVGKIASFGPLGIAGDLILGTAGIASQSLSIDGLSQSVGTTASATYAGYSARLKQYKEEITTSAKRLKLVYDQPKFMVL